MFLMSHSKSEGSNASNRKETAADLRQGNKN